MLLKSDFLLSMGILIEWDEFAPALFGPVLSPLSIAQKNTRI